MGFSSLARAKRKAEPSWPPFPLPLLISWGYEIDKKSNQQTRKSISHIIHACM